MRYWCGPNPQWPTLVITSCPTSFHTHVSFHIKRQKRIARGISKGIYYSCRLLFVRSTYFVTNYSKIWRLILSDLQRFTHSEIQNLKFIYSGKATKFCKISTLLLSYVVPVKSKVENSQNFVAFSEYTNFKRSSSNTKKGKNVPCSILNEVAVHTKSYKEGNFYKYVPCVHTLKYWENASGINKISVLKNN